MDRRNIVSAVVALGVILIIAAVCLAGEPPDQPWRRARRLRAGQLAVRGQVLAAAAGDVNGTNGCAGVAPLQLYRFIEGADTCPQPMSTPDIAKLQDPFAVQVLRKGIGDAALWPTSVEQIVSLIAANPTFKANQLNYMLGEGSQIGTTVASRDASRNLRYVITWGANSTPSIFLSALPTGTHPGKPAPFLQVIGYDQARKVFNYYQFIGTWAWAGDSTGSRDPRTAGQGCFTCHINGALNMKERATPWNNWSSPRASIVAANIPATVASDPLYTSLAGADELEISFNGLQSQYTQALVASFIVNGAISNVPALLKRLITTTTVNLGSSQSKPGDSTAVAVPPDFFLNQDALTMPQIGISYNIPASLAIARDQHDAFVRQHGFELVQSDAVPGYRQPGTTYFDFFVPLPAFEDMVAIREMVNQKVITPNFAAAVLMVDFQNPVFSARRSSLMSYAQQITTGRTVSSMPDPRDVPSQFTALVTAAAKGQPPCNSAQLAQCTPEQQFLYYAGQSDWKQRAANQINPYLAAVGKRILTPQGADDYMRLSVSRQAQFASDPGVCPLNEFSLLLPQTTQCRLMNVDGTSDPTSRCSSPQCNLN